DSGVAGVVEGAAAVRFDTDGSDDGRRVGELRDDRRCGHRRAGRADRLCGPARDRADGPRKASGRIPARLVSAGKRRDRHDRRPAPAQGRTAETADLVAAAAAADRLTRHPRRIPRRRPVSPPSTLAEWLPYSETTTPTDVPA